MNTIEEREERIVKAMRARANAWPEARMTSTVQTLLGNFEHIPRYKQVDIVADFIKEGLKMELHSMANLIERGEV